MNQWSITKRPRVLNDLYGLENIKKYVYEKAKTQDWPKATLLRGQFGNGKSTAANIMAAMMVCQRPLPNGDPCLTCASCMAIVEEKFDRDVIRIDGGMAGKAEVVDIVNEHIATPPMFDKRKVIIIEEVQELSTAAKNSLLKTLEHPRDKIHFILLSMEYGGAPTGFASRCVPFNFKRLTTKELMFYLKDILEKEGLWDNEELPKEFKFQGIATIAQVSGGSIRQALQLLDMCLTGKYFTTEAIRENLGYVDELSAIETLILLLNRADSVWEKLARYEPGEFFAIAYKIMSDAAMFKASGFLADEGNPWIVDNTKMVAGSSNFDVLLATFNRLAPVSKPYLRKAELISYLVEAFNNMPIPGTKIKMQEAGSAPVQNPPTRPVRTIPTK